jgi:predicted CXXCH cytochrome family protein
MSRSLYRPSSANVVEDFVTRNTVYNRASGDYYTMIRRGSEYYQRRHQIGFDGKETNVMEERVDYVIGSGDQARSYLHRTSEGRLVELPVTWYAEGGGYWEMSPGYDFAGQEDFHGVVSKGCIFCHNAYPPPLPREIENRGEPIFAGALPLGIDCQRCHGPGSEHEKAARSSNPNYAVVQAAIVNPLRLGRERQLEVCMECHLSTSGSQDANISLRFNRDIFSYRPGEPLAGYKLYFDSGVKADVGGFDIADAAYRLRMSLCFKKSQMTCLSCHDPHRESRGRLAEANYLRVCASCHGGAAHRFPLPKNETCLSCHMPKRRGEYAVHTILTDHYIQRQKPRRDLLAHLAPPGPSGDNPSKLVPYYPETLSRQGDDQLYLFMAQSENSAKPEDGAKALETAIQRYAPAEAGFYTALGDAYARSGSYAQAIKWLEEARRRSPADRLILGKLVNSLIASGQLGQAQQILEGAISDAPADARVLANLGNVYARQGQLQKADATLQKALSTDPELAQAYNLLGMVKEREADEAAADRLYREAIRYRPDLVEARRNLATLSVANDRFDEANFEFKQAIAMAPGFAEAHHSYGLFLVATKSHALAETQLREAVRLDPGVAVYHSDLGDSLVELDRPGEAIEQYKNALQLDSNLDAANVGLGMVLVRQGDISAGEKYCSAALKSADESVVQQANACLRR